MQAQHTEHPSDPAAEVAGVLWSIGHRCGGCLGTLRVAVTLLRARLCSASPAGAER